MPPSCPHPKPILIDNGDLRPARRCMPFDAAWCPACGALRESSATKDPEPWTLPQNAMAPETGHADFGI